MAQVSGYAIVNSLTWERVLDLRPFHGGLSSLDCIAVREIRAADALAKLTLRSL